MTKTKNQTSFNVSRELNINVSPDKLWQIIGHRFEDAYIWASSVDHSKGGGTPEFEGATCSERFCDVNAKGFNKISEKLVKYSNEDMTLAYVVLEGMPSFITHAQNDWTVEPTGIHQSKLVMKADFSLQGIMGRFMKPMMKSKMEKLLDVVLNDAKIFAETGSISETKRKRNELLEKQNLIAA
jgi:hypothetical protein